jgi:hypothetical protein
MKSKHKLMRLLSVVIIFGVLITACGGPAPTEAPVTEAAGKMYEGVTVNC